ncbi:MAG: hypothetical protein HQ471_07415 [Flavobacteriales bacterium]|nr:hypothetical protein [Flavobacteriales bacterium]
MNLNCIIKKITTIVLGAFCFISLFSCNSSAELRRDELIYNNNFATGDLTEIDGGAIMTFNNQKVLGNYNNDGFTVHLNNIGSHDYIYISFDLYLHDSWDGNFNNIEPDQPDSWFIELRPDIESYPTIPFNIWESTFSNSVCNEIYCLRQSYPDIFPSENKPRLGSATQLPGLCSLANNNDGTSMYKIEKGFEHSGNALLIRFYDKLYQPNAVDEKCDESWSMGNLKIRVITFE